jgi:hypothetical protein
MCTLFGWLVVGFMQVGPEVYEVQLIDDAGHVVEYVLIKK